MRLFTKKAIVCVLFYFVTINNIFAQNIQILNISDFREGDLLFQDLDCGDLCDAIEKVTKGNKTYNISHVGIVVTRNDSIFIEEALGEKVRLTSPSAFLQRSVTSSGTPKIIASRTKPAYTGSAGRAAKEALKYLNTPYDDSFEPGDSKLYCSELVYYSFKTANYSREFFPLHNMTFHDPETGATFPVWTEYFEKLHLPVPEGKTGCNPADYSVSDKLDIYFSFAGQETSVQLQEQKQKLNVLQEKEEQDKTERKSDNKQYNQTIKNN